MPIPHGSCLSWEVVIDTASFALYLLCEVRVMQLTDKCPLLTDYGLMVYNLHKGSQQREREGEGFRKKIMFFWLPGRPLRILARPPPLPAHKTPGRSTIYLYIRIFTAIRPLKKKGGIGKAEEVSKEFHKKNYLTWAVGACYRGRDRRV